MDAGAILGGGQNDLGCVGGERLDGYSTFKGCGLGRFSGGN